MKRINDIIERRNYAATYGVKPLEYQNTTDLLVAIDTLVDEVKRIADALDMYMGKEGKDGQYTEHDRLGNELNGTPPGPYKDSEHYADEQ